MRLSPPRVSIKGLMILVAILALATLAAKELRLRWLRQHHQNAVTPSQLRANVGNPFFPDFVPGTPIPVSIFYDFRFNGVSPVPEEGVLLLGSVWFEDFETRRSVDGYTFDARLVLGGREQATENFTWDALISRPGRYYLCYRLMYQTPTGEWKFFNGGSMLCHFTEAGQPSMETGAKP